MSHSSEYEYSKKSFDLTDSLLSGLCSNSSRPDNNNSTNIKSLNMISSSSKNTKSTIKNDESLISTKSRNSSDINNTSSSGIHGSSYIKSDINDSSSSNINDVSNDSDINNISSKIYSSNCDINNLSNDSDNSSNDFESNNISKSLPKKNRNVSLSVLPARADPFVYDRKTNTIRYNFQRCISSGATVIFGGKDGNFTFNPMTSTLTSGSGNLTELHNSLNVGSNNKIKLEVMKNNNNNNNNCNNNNHKNNAIIASVDSELINSTNSAIIGCSGVELKGCSETVALAIKATSEDQFPENLNETLLVRNIHVAGSLSASHIRQNSLYVSGNSQRDTYYQIKKGDGVDIIYANPIDGPIYIQLGVPKDMAFEANKVITIKDVTLEFADTSVNHVSVFVPPTDSIEQTRIEYYDGQLLKVSSGRSAGYVINTHGGSVTYRYMTPFMPGQSPTWIIQNQFLGNRPLTFQQADIQTRSKLMRK